MSNDERARAIELAQKLLRLAAPDSGTTDAERTSAALHAAKVIAQHKLEVSVPVERVRKKRPAPSPQPPPRPRYNSGASYGVYSTPTVMRPQYRASYQNNNDWREVQVTIPSHCVICRMPLVRGDEAFFSTEHGYRCHDIGSCGQ